MSEQIVTYVSANAKPGREWAAYVDLGHDYLGIRFHGSTEVEARDKADAFWRAGQERRERTIAQRKEAQAKAAETKARRKAGPEPVGTP